MLQHPLPATVTALTPAHRALGAASRINEKNNIKTDCSPRVEHMYVKAVPSNRLHVHIINDNHPVWYHYTVVHEILHLHMHNMNSG